MRTNEQGFYILIWYADLRPLGIPIVKSNSQELDFVKRVKGKRPSWQHYNSIVCPSHTVQGRVWSGKDSGTLNFQNVFFLFHTECSKYDFFGPYNLFLNGIKDNLDTFWYC
jgi:hypothetical protein